MQRFNDPTAIPDTARGAVAAIGNFDGVHLGHRAVLDQARAEATRRNVPLAVLTFEPHPRAYFADLAGKAGAPFRLMTADARANRLEKLGVDVLFEVPFTADLAALSAQAFAREILLRDAGLAHVFVGADFCFGKGRSGSVHTLAELGAQLGFGVSVADMVALEGGEVSSTAIRSALQEGRPRDAAVQLGHWHRIEGPVQHGEKRGRELGYPTANQSIDAVLLPRLGVYATVVDVLDGPHKGSYHGATSIGVRPMFGENTPNCETYIFDFKGDLYDTRLSVGLVSYLRGEDSFASLEALLEQMALDCAQARDILALL